MLKAPCTVFNVRIKGNRPQHSPLQEASFVAASESLSHSTYRLEAFPSLKVAYQRDIIQMISAVVHCLEALASDDGGLWSENIGFYARVGRCLLVGNGVYHKCPR